VQTDRLQRRVQRYGWDLAVEHYARHWQAPLAGLHARLLEQARLAPGERVLDVACGTGIVALEAARRVGPGGQVLGVDLSGRMVEAAQRLARAQGLGHAAFARMDAQALQLRDAGGDDGFDAALCALGLMYAPDPAAALGEMHRVIRPGGRVAVAVWGARERCGWAPLFGIVDDEVRSEVCPLFFALGQGDALSRLCARVGLRVRTQQRLTGWLDYDNADSACDAAFSGGPVALAWSRFDATVRARVRQRYLQAIDGWREGAVAYRVPAEFVIVSAERV
jgi:SAM-dependent methyltransferase